MINVAIIETINLVKPHTPSIMKTPQTLIHFDKMEIIFQVQSVSV
jgi:hypothetical protein